MFDQKFNQMGVIGLNVNGPGLDLGEHSFVEIVNRECHLRMLANALTFGNCGSPHFCSPHDSSPNALWSPT